MAVNQTGQKKERFRMPAKSLLEDYAHAAVGFIVGFAAIFLVLIFETIAITVSVVFPSTRKLSGMTATLLGGAFSAQTLAFLILASCLTSIPCVFCHRYNRVQATQNPATHTTKPPRIEKVLRSTCDGLRKVTKLFYNGIPFGMGLFLAGFAVALVGKWWFEIENRLNGWTFVCVLLAAALSLVLVRLIAADILETRFKSPANNRGLVLLAIIMLLFLGISSVMAVHLNTAD